MYCLSLGWLEQLLLWLVVIGAIVALIRLVVPLVVGPLGPPGAAIVGALNIVLWAIVCIAVIFIVFDLLPCLLGVPRLRP